MKTELTAFALLCSLVGCGSSTITTRLPATFPPELKAGETINEYACESINVTSIYADMEEDKIQSSIRKGSDNLSLKIEGDLLKMLTVASVKAGTIDAAPLKILYNTDDYLHAMDLEGNPPGNLLTTFTLNKKKGYAIWNRIRAQATMSRTKNPETDSYYMVCR